MKHAVRGRLALVAMLLALGGCSTTRFYPHEATENVHPGKGGSRFSYQGLDVWFNGEPSRPYEILGYIEDPRGLYADDDHRRVETGVLEKAREVGADALIEQIIPGRTLPSSSMMFNNGFGRRGFGMGMGFDLAADRISVKYIAVRYLDKP